MKIFKLTMGVLIGFLAHMAEAKFVLQIEYENQEHRLVKTIQVDNKNKFSHHANDANVLKNVDENRAYVSYTSSNQDYFVYIDDPRIVGTPVTEMQNNDHVSMDAGSYLVTITHSSFDLHSLKVNFPSLVVNNRQTLFPEVISIIVDE